MVKDKPNGSRASRDGAPKNATSSRSRARSMQPPPPASNTTAYGPEIVEQQLCTITVSYKKKFLTFANLKSQITNKHPSLFL